MTIRWVGCILIIAASSFCGFSSAMRYRQEERNLHQLHLVIQNMECELSYHLSPLPELVEHGAVFASGALKELLYCFAANLKQQHFPDAESCLHAALNKRADFSPRVLELLSLFSNSLGRFDLPGQLKGFSEVQSMISAAQEQLAHNRDNRLRSCSVLGICSGIALAILLI